MVQIAILLSVVQAAAAICFSQAILTLQTYCKDYIGLTKIGPRPSAPADVVPSGNQRIQK